MSKTSPSKMTDVDLFLDWKRLLVELKAIFGKEPDVNGCLFLIGIQELGKGLQEYTKEEKQDLMHIATCRILSPLGFYTLEGHDAQGWPIWTLKEAIPQLHLEAQEHLLKSQIVSYFKENQLLG